MGVIPCVDIEDLCRNGGCLVAVGCDWVLGV
jgi:hypothetical protein